MCQKTQNQYLAESKNQNPTKKSLKNLLKIILKNILNIAQNSYQSNSTKQNYTNKSLPKYLTIKLARFSYYGEVSKNFMRITRIFTFLYYNPPRSIKTK